MTQTTEGVLSLEWGKGGESECDPEAPKWKADLKGLIMDGCCRTHRMQVGWELYIGTKSLGQ